jgi:hypothetical protein
MGIAMFGWFNSPKPRKPRALTVDYIGDILAKYGELLEKHRTVFIDESWLPVPKDEMRRVFKAAWLISPTPEMRNHIEVGWTFLSMFRPGIGSLPVDALAPDDVSSESIKRLERFVELSKDSQAEGERDWKEKQEFIRANTERQHGAS